MASETQGAQVPSAVTPVKTLVLDAGPLLSLTPLRNVATKYLTTPAVLAELRDVNAREHWERLKLLQDIDVEVREPDAVSMSKVMAWAKHTGDIAVLSRTDLGVIALTYAAEVEMNGFANIREAPLGADAAVAQPKVTSEPVTVPKAPAVNPWGKTVAPAQVEPRAEEAAEEDAFPALHSTRPKKGQASDVTSKMGSLSLEPHSETPSQPEVEERSSVSAPPPEDQRRTQVYAEEEASDAASDSDDSDAGEWITPENVVTHKSQDLGLAPSGYSAEGVFQPAPTKTRKDRGRKGKGKALAATQGKALDVACMTGDYAVQNVIMQIGLNLVGTGGKKMAQVKSWVLRCHACFKVCKDPSKKFCPSCGSPSLIRASVTTTGGANPTTQIHLKQNFQYRTRGTKYSIPDPKMGSAKGQKAGGTGLILREDQKEFMDGMRREEIRRQKEERQLERAAKAQAEGKGKGLGAWNDPDWLPEILSVGMSGKGRHEAGDNLPQVGHGRRNPNQVRKSRK
ncbi:hypothetical protein NliqN6_4627 [Naganishia liquefaciens]|uniref:20S-pre-rRNA D-site endonuclease NOB1 n=1 Tax=Naganishia liquefaciens TaxID=104408 RepID=A0A8H3YFY5_9TREE|nr:hypothetical protein NliqN6_4627 [Naganishia liquefaciens]